MLKRRHQGSRVVRQDAIFAHLRKEIISGKLGPGDRLPAQSQVVKGFGSSPLTVERVFRRLVAMGFARTEPRKGTFVTEHPPHLFRYALVFPNHPGGFEGHTWSRFDRAMSEAASRVNRKGARQVSIYYDCNGHSDSEGFGRLLDDIRADTLAGVMFSFAPHNLVGGAIFEFDNMPMVGGDAPIGQHLPAVGHDPLSFLNRTIDLLREQGRRNVAFLTTPTTFPGFWDVVPKLIRDRGMTSLPYWTQAVTPFEPFWVRHAVHAMLHSHEGWRPDGLIVTDDHLVEPLADVLVAMGVRVPEDLWVVGHWNFPLPYERELPIQRLGWDAVELLERWMANIDAQRRGEQVPSRASILPRLEHELIHVNEVSP